MQNISHIYIFLFKSYVKTSMIFASTLKTFYLSLEDGKKDFFFPCVTHGNLILNPYC